jgi:hypothetical protein
MRAQQGAQAVEIIERGVSIRLSEALDLVTKGHLAPEERGGQERAGGTPGRGLAARVRPREQAPREAHHTE